MKAYRDGAKAREERSLRAELEEQAVSQPELERRFKQQENERKRREAERRAEAECEELEREIEFTGTYRSGFNT